MNYEISLVGMMNSMISLWSYVYMCLCGHRCVYGFVHLWRTKVNLRMLLTWFFETDLVDPGAL